MPYSVEQVMKLTGNVVLGIRKNTAEIKKTFVYSYKSSYE